MTYQEFLHNKAQLEGEHGFAPIRLHDALFDFQQHLVEWALRKQSNVFDSRQTRQVFI